jgi:hypothetical protein
MCTGSGEASRAGSDPLWIWQLGGFAADPPTGSGSTSQLIMRTYPDARLRADARGRDGGVREELEAKGVDRPAGGSIQNELSRSLISQDFLPRSGTNRHLQDALRDKRFSRASGTTADQRARSSCLAAASERAFGYARACSRSPIQRLAPLCHLRHRLARLNTTLAIIDGEVVIVTERGDTDFGELETYVSPKTPPAHLVDKLVFYAFDVLYADGFDLRGCLSARSQAHPQRATLGPRKGQSDQYSDHLFDSGKDVFANACTMQLEGIVSPSSAGLRVSSFGRPVRWRAG